MRTTEIEVSNGYVSFEHSSDLYEKTQGAGNIDNCIEIGQCCLSDGCDYVFSVYEIEQLKTIKEVGTRGDNWGPGFGYIKLQKDTILQSIETMLVDGNRLDINPDIKMINYAKVKAVLLKAGGVYKKNGFDFKSDAMEVYIRLLSGEKIDDKKKFQFFETPEKIVDKLHSLLKIKDTDKILEPSAGKGRLLKGLNKENIHCVELMEENKVFLLTEGFNVIGNNFIETSNDNKYDIIIANPPFTKNQDIDHFKKMYELVREGGQIASIMSTHWLHSQTKKCKEFRDFLEFVDHELIMIDAGEFKESGTTIPTCIIHLRA